MEVPQMSAVGSHAATATLALVNSKESASYPANPNNNLNRDFFEAPASISVSLQTTSV